MADAFALEKLIQAFNPTTLDEQLDVMSAKLAMAIDLSDITQVNTLKLSLSRIIDTVNNGVMSVFRQYLNNQVWEKINDIDMNISEGMSTADKQLYQDILTRGTVNGKLDKEIRIAIAEEKAVNAEV
ncbi:Protein phosphatase [Mucor velutinosus]|uniref:Protein phosphatase n=1 Tax=Mucor velutinosus TaxID=708070 RepID=A0AAN7D6H9_9FUNG|nr:Protein phosphatase [Mucor velutinosus]